MITIAAVALLTLVADLDDERKAYVLCCAAQAMQPGMLCVPPEPVDE